MSEKKLILALDQGTTSSRAIVFDHEANIVAVAQQEFPQHYPNNGWVEHDPEDIWSTTVWVAKEALAEAEKGGDKVVAIGITNQRETTLVWNKVTGKTIYNAIVWQDRRTSEVCQTLKEKGLEDSVHERTGLLLDPYFSGTKVAWILDNVDGARSAADAGELAFGTVDSFLISRLTGNKKHVTDATNASRTNLYNIHTGDWDETLLDIFSVPRSVLPEVLDCAADFGVTDSGILGREIPIFGVAGDQQAAAIGQCCFDIGDTKSTYGTGCFALMNTGSEAVNSEHRLLTTVAYQLEGKTTYALEGSIFIAGAAVQWLRDELGLIDNAKQTEELVKNLDNNGGVYLVPAFTGLGAPYWEPDVRGALFGITRSTGRAEVVRASLESVCYQTYDLISSMSADASLPQRVRVDGGMVANSWLMQFLSDTLNIQIDRPCITETTALGVAFLAGLKAGIYSDLEDISKTWQIERAFTPQMGASDRQSNIDGWKDAVQRVLR
ncbi:glycerol kinase GlpK [Agarilytica rhodophyticola]|uniref:glycerol kinase GlpK n=1 Tax=Agarilytica rhodophyticola TaxID=1737490 RepID=UPI000B341CD3|nr:glycerol kinase GlpK [Agarilytica rhodophyticola]